MIFKMIHPIKNYRINKLSKHLGLIYKTKNYLNKKSFGKSVLFLHTDILQLWKDGMMELIFYKS